MVGAVGGAGRKRGSCDTRVAGERGVRTAEIIVALAICCVVLRIASALVLSLRWLRDWALPLLLRNALAEQQETARRQRSYGVSLSRNGNGGAVRPPGVSELI